MEPQSRYNSRILRKSLIVSLLCLSLGLSAAAQDESALIPEVFQKENAVMTRSTERLDFDYRKGKLEATTSVQTEIRLLTDVAPALYNTISFSHGYFASLKDMEGYALVPEGKGFKKVRAREFKTVKATSSAIFFDDAHQTTITFTGLTKGASTVASYKLHHHDVHFLPAFYF